MTEEEAKTKWCPFVRFHVEGKAPTFTVAPNREQRGTRCIGSACMAWRAANPARETIKNYRDAPVVDERWDFGQRVLPDGWQYSHTDRDRDNREFDVLHRPSADIADHGSCGLAGPQ